MGRGCEECRFLLRFLEDLLEAGDGSGSSGSEEADGVLELVLGIVDVEESVIDVCHCGPAFHAANRIVGTFPGSDFTVE